MQSSVLLVGGTGYLGSHLSAYLEKRGYNIFRTGTKNRGYKKYYQIDFGVPSTFKALQGKKFDLIIILASKIEALGIDDLSHPDLKTNTIDLASFLEFISKHDLCSKLVYVSSMTVYSIENDVPVTEKGDLRPPHVYGLSKVMAEKIVQYFSRASKVPSVVWRIPGIYGGNRKSGFIYNAIQKIRNDQPFVVNTKNLGYWETIYVFDLCKLIARFLTKYQWNNNSAIFNLAYGEKTDICEAAKFIAKELDSSENLEFRDIKGYVPFNLSTQKVESHIEIDEEFYSSLKKYIRIISK